MATRRGGTRKAPLSARPSSTSAMCPILVPPGTGVSNVQLTEWLVPDVHGGDTGPNPVGALRLRRCSRRFPPDSGARWPTASTRRSGMPPQRLVYLVPPVQRPRRAETSVMRVGRGTAIRRFPAFVVAAVCTRSQCVPPAGGRAPVWRAGLVATRRTAERPSRLGGDALGITGTTRRGIADGQRERPADGEHGWPRPIANPIASR
jgi:hypothetical protein